MILAASGRAPLVVLLFVIAGATTSFAATARVSYVTSRTFYVDAGTQDGLSVGALVEIVREGVVVGSGRVREVSTRRGACDWIEGETAVAVGDTIRFEAVTRAESPSTAQSSWWGRSGLHGRIGMQSLHLRDHSGGGRDLDQPALDLRLRGDAVVGTPLSVEADIRARAIHRSTGAFEGTRSHSRVYRLNTSADFAGLRFVAGRQYAPMVHALNLFDGARLESMGQRWNFGVLAGTQPRSVDLGLSTRVFEAGVWATRRSTTPVQSWELTAAAIGSYEESTLDREALLLQGRWNNATWSTRIEQEIDLNRSWKNEAGESTLSATSTNFFVRWRMHRSSSLDFGLDTRRRVRLYRDRETPETDFDDTYRRGVWVGVHTRPLRGLDLGLRARSRGGAGASSADALTFTTAYRARWLGSWRLSTRSTVYRNELVEGWLNSGTLGRSIGTRLETAVFGGVRKETGRSNDLMDGSDPWFGMEFDVLLTHRAWMSGTYERSFEGEEAYEQVWLGTGLRF